MTGIIIDPSLGDAECLRSLCAAAGGPEIGGLFKSASDAAASLLLRRTEVIFCAWEISEVERAALSRALRSAAPGAALIITAGAEVGAAEAFEAGASGCLLKPVRADKLAACLERLSASGGGRRRVRIHTFGHFDLYVDGVAVVFRNSRAKEMMALLVDSQGGTVTMDRFIETFWPEEPDSEQHKAIYRKASLALKKTLEEYGIEGILLSSRNQKALVPTVVDCDYYRYLAGEQQAVSQYHGEYMVDYSWAEETNSRLWRLAQRRGDVV